MSIPPTINGAAVHDPTKAPLEIIMLRSWPTVSASIDAQHEIIAPVVRTVRQHCGNEQRVRRTKQPDFGDSLPGPDANLGRPVASAVGCLIRPWQKRNGANAK